MRPKVTIIIPNYNHARFLTMRLSSILEQTYKNFEAIFLDDASTDNSREVFSTFNKNNEFRFVFNEQNSGNPFKQWDKGIKLAKGEYIWIAESDDYAEPDFLRILTQKMEDNPRVGVAYCQSRYVDENDQLLNSASDWTKDLDEKRWQSDFVNKGRDECRNFLIHKNTILNASAVLFKKDIYLKTNEENEDMKITGDWLIWINMLLHSDLAFISQELNYFRQHAASVRGKTLWDGTIIQEQYKILSHIIRHIEIPQEALNDKLDSILFDLAKIITSRNNRMDMGTYKKLYNSAKEYDPILKRRLIKIFGLFILKKFFTNESFCNK